MNKPIIKDPIFLAQKSTDATVQDKQVAQDLLDTLAANAQGCVGMAANMIGFSKSIIAVRDGIVQFVMFNPVITKKKDAFETEEGCLSLDGKRKTIRYQKITVEYQDQLLRKRQGDFEGWVAQIIQHEVDHCNGILI